MKTCSRCKFSKPKKDFHLCSRALSKCQSACKECLNSLQRENHKSNPEKRRSYVRKKYHENPDAHKSRVRAWERANPTARRNKELKSLYGITFSEFEAKTKEQNGRCAVCKKKRKPLCVDHNHATGKVRGLLCRACNTSIGMLDDSPEMCEAAAMYLRKFSSPNLVGNP